MFLLAQIQTSGRAYNRTHFGAFLNGLSVTYGPVIATCQIHIHYMSHAHLSLFHTIQYTFQNSRTTFPNTPKKPLISHPAPPKILYIYFPFPLTVQTLCALEYIHAHFSVLESSDLLSCNGNRSVFCGDRRDRLLHPKTQWISYSDKGPSATAA